MCQDLLDIKTKTYCYTIEKHSPLPKMVIFISALLKKNESINTTHSFITWLDSQCLPFVYQALSTLCGLFFSSPFVVVLFSICVSLLQTKINYYILCNNLCTQNYSRPPVLWFYVGAKKEGENDRKNENSWGKCERRRKDFRWQRKQGTGEINRKQMRKIT